MRTKLFIFVFEPGLHWKRWIRWIKSVLFHLIHLLQRYVVSWVKIPKYLMIYQKNRFESIYSKNSWLCSSSLFMKKTRNIILKTHNIRIWFKRTYIVITKYQKFFFENIHYWFLSYSVYSFKILYSANIINCKIKIPDQYFL